MSNCENKKYGIDCVYPLEFEQVDLRKRGVWDEKSRRNSFTTYYRELWSDAWMCRSYEGQGYDDCNGRFMRHGKGKEIGVDGYVRYEGEFMHGMACGKGKLYYASGALMYDGEFWLNKWHGRGKLYFENGKIHIDGVFSNGLVDGWGLVYYDSGILCYEGDIKDGKTHGYGRKYNEDGTLYYEGTVNMGEADGKGRLYHSNGNLEYEGEVKTGDFEGRGREYDGNGVLKYEGEFVKGEYCGQGRLYDPETGKLIREGMFPEESEPEESVSTLGALRDFLKNQNDEPSDLPAETIGFRLSNKAEKSIEEFWEKEFEEEERRE